MTDTIRAIEIDPATGLFVADLPHHPADETGPNIVTTLCPEGFHSPRWDGSAWVEGKPQSEISETVRAAKKAQVLGISAMKVQQSYSTNRQIELIAASTAVLNKSRKGQATAEEQSRMDALQSEYETNVLPVLNRRDQLLADLDAAADPATVDIESGWPV